MSEEEHKALLMDICKAIAKQVEYDVKLTETTAYIAQGLLAVQEQMILLRKEVEEMNKSTIKFN